jgi:hypothetical protein
MSSARWVIFIAAVGVMGQTGYHAGNDLETPPRISASQLPPLPVTLYAPARPMDTVRAVFQFAALHPEVLHHIPCFCGCQNMGHRHNDDCFVKSRDERGVPTEWEAHGMG